MQYFNKSFLDTCRLEVTQAESFKTIDKEATRPRGKHARAKQEQEQAAKNAAGSGATVGAKRKRAPGATEVSHV